MIISRTPFRISLLGGGTDFPDYYLKYGGSVLSMSINKYCYITCRYLPPFFDYKYRVRYYEREETNNIDQIKHPSVRECLKYTKISKGVEIVHHADLPAMSGLGSSSTFTVGLLNALYTLQSKMITKKALALEAIYIEQKIIGESVGSQDQTAAAFGGFNNINFAQKGIEVTPVLSSESRIYELHSHMLLFFTGFSRVASEISKEQINLLDKNISQLDDIRDSVNEGLKIINSNSSISDLGKLIGEQWKIKRTLTNKISSESIDSIYDIGIKNGAYGGKLLGAGGGGFILFIADPQNHFKIKTALSNLLYVPFKIDYLGSQIVYYSKDDDIEKE
jgi:D-glycero-alpha-D-manno-heptose-7-phosphate kinase